MTKHKCRKCKREVENRLWAYNKQNICQNCNMENPVKYLTFNNRINELNKKLIGMENKYELQMSDLYSRISHLQELLKVFKVK